MFIDIFVISVRICCFRIYLWRVNKFIIEQMHYPWNIPDPIDFLYPSFEASLMV